MSPVDGLSRRKLLGGALALGAVAGAVPRTASAQAVAHTFKAGAAAG